MLALQILLLGVLGECAEKKKKKKNRRPFLKVLAVRFCGRHAGDQGSGRTDWAGPQPPGSPGTRLFNHGAAKQSDGELHTPLVSLLPLCLCLHLCLSRSASLLLRLFPLRPHPADAAAAATATATRLSALFLLQLVITL